jgi:Protein of unknown function (DUF993)
LERTFKSASPKRVALRSGIQGTSFYRLKWLPSALPPTPHHFDRMALSAANVVADPFAGAEPAKGPSIDWTTTISFRRYILDLGLGVAEAMDTAQRGTGLGWDELIRRSLDAASAEERKRIYSGERTDHLDPAEAHSLDDAIRPYLEQIEAIQRLDAHHSHGEPSARASREIAKRLRNRIPARAFPLATGRRSCTGSATCSMVRNQYGNAGHNKAPIGDTVDKVARFEFGAICL